MGNVSKPVNTTVTAIEAGECCIAWLRTRSDESIEAWHGVVAGVDMAGIRVHCVYEQDDVQEYPSEAIRFAPWGRVSDIQILEPAGVAEGVR